MLRPLNQPPPADPDAREMRVFVRVRDEAARMPHFLEHYRRLGVDRFVAVDNGSTDGTTELLASEPDVHLFAADGSYREARGGQAWLDWLLDRYGAGRWCLVLDADELLFYPGMETRSLRSLCGALEREAAPFGGWPNISASTAPIRSGNRLTRPGNRSSPRVLGSMPRPIGGPDRTCALITRSMAGSASACSIRAGRSRTSRCA